MDFLKGCVISLLVLLSFSVSGAKNIRISNGFLDLRHQNVERLGEIEFNGTWEFYWGKLLLPEDFDTVNSEGINYIQLPSVWNSYKVDGKNLPGQGAATYRLRILNNKPDKLAFKLGSVGTAFKLFVDDSLICQSGKVSLHKEKSAPGYLPGVFSFKTKSDTTSVIFQVSNHHYSKGGLWNNFYSLGSHPVILKSWNREIQLSLIMVGAMLIFALYHLGLYLINRNFRYTLYFSLFCLVIAIRTLVVNEIYLLDILPNFSWEALIKTEYITLLAGTLTFVMFIYKFFEKLFGKLMLKIILTITIIFTLVVLTAKPVFFTRYLVLYQLNILLASGYIIFVVVKGLKHRKQSSTILLIGFIILLLSIINDILYTNKLINTIYLTSFGFIIFIFSQGIMLSHRFSNLFVQTESLANRLEATNQNLETLVQKRTEKIQEQNDTLIEQRNEITIKKVKLEKQNEEIIAQSENLKRQHKVLNRQKKQITSSIEYASSIQNAVLNHTNDIGRVTPEHFILFHPKDIVSGDFYWFKQIKIQQKRYKIATVVDCTGHGVPGAFMSILGTLFLNKIVGEFNELPKASEILNRMRNEVKALLQQNSESKIVKDGMDMALIIIDEDDKSMQFAGAQNAIYIIRNPNNKPSEIIEEYKGDKMPIGTYVKEKDSFTNQIIKINSGDLIYLFTDGYYDQFGGKTGEKLKKKNFRNTLLKNASLSMNKQKVELERYLFSWRGNYEQIDDVTVIGLKVP